MQGVEAHARDYPWANPFGPGALSLALTSKAWRSATRPLSAVKNSGSTKRGDRDANCRIRAAFAFDRHICYAIGDRKWSSGESRPKGLGEGLTRCSWGFCVGYAVASGAARKIASLLPSRTAKRQCERNGQNRPQRAGRNRREKAEFERQGVVDDMTAIWGIGIECHYPALPKPLATNSGLG